MNALHISITKRDNTRVPFDAERINRSIERACRGLDNIPQKVAQIGSETELTLYDGVTTRELDEATINAALQNVQDDIQYDRVATRLLLKTIYKEVLGDFDTDDEEVVAKRHREQFPEFIKSKVAEGLLDPRMGQVFDLARLAAHLDVSRDELFRYSGASTLSHRYSLKHNGDVPAETPQFTFMRVAMGLSYNEQDPTAQALKFYDGLSKLRYTAGGSTYIGSGTVRPAMSNCFLIDMQDDMEHIAKTTGDVLKISKATGGLGVNVTQLRATGSILKSSNTTSSGAVPFMKIMDVAIRAIVRGGKKKGALAFYMETWHYDFPAFIETRHNAGDDHMRMRTANIAAFMSDEFIKRVKTNADWYLFDPNETRDLIDLYGAAFSKRYKEYVEMAERGELRLWKKVRATELYRQMLVALQGTAHPWQLWKGNVNLRALNNNTGTIRMSNLCTEICLPEDRDNIAVCNLASVNLAAHINAETKQINWQQLEETVRIGVRHLDNLIDINDLPVAEARKSDSENRAVGLGAMGLADVFEQFALAYDSEEAYLLTDQIFEFVSYMAIDESANLARERGSYQNFPGSGWSLGMVPIDTLTTLELDRGMPLTVDKGSHHKGLDWDRLRVKVAEGIRNATLMAIAPNANSGLVAGTTPGVDVRFAQVFSRKKFSGKYIDINHNLVHELEELGLWEKVGPKLVEYQGDIASISEIPMELREIYKTSFSTDPDGVIEVAARAQKWIDQAISRNMYLETRNIDDMMNYYLNAWDKGLKSTYYLHMKPRHTAEQSTTKVNKATGLGKVGFGALRNRNQAPVMDDSIEEVAEPVVTPASAPMPSVVAPREPVTVAAKTAPNMCPVDPAERALCDSCG